MAPVALISGLTWHCTSPDRSSCFSSGIHSYDLNGNLISRNETTTSTARWTYAWDPAGRLTRVSNGAGIQGLYAYDASGRRVMSTEGSTTTFYSYTGASVLYQRDSTGASTDYVFANGILVARLVSASTVSYYHADALGSTRMVTDASGHVTFSDGYRPYGQDNGTPSGSETNKFTGKPVSQTTGLYYEYRRWYDPSIGRFISQDPLAGHLSDPQSLNPYVYVENIPTSLTDPTGMGYTNGSEGCGWTSNWGGCLLSGIMATGAWYTSLSPEEKQIVGIGALAAITVATGGTDLLLVGAIGFGVGYNAYAGYAYATGGTPNLQDALFWGTIGFGAGLGIDSLGELLSGSADIGSLSAADRLAANRAAGLAYESDAADALGLTRNIGAGRVIVEGTETAGRAVPDYVGDTFLGEAKFTQGTIYNTRQIRIIIEAAAQQGKDLQIVLPEGAKIAPTVFRWAFRFGVKIIPVPF